MSRRTVLGCVLVLLAGVPARAQIPFARDLVPTRTSLARLGLERQWMGVVPLVNDERLTSVSMAEDLIFAQTNKANFHAFNAESGKLLWSARLGIQTARARPASVNSFAVFLTNMSVLYALDRNTGRTIWSHDLGTLPSSPTACDEERVMVGLNNGKIYGFDLKVRAEGKSRISDRPIELWNWQTGGPIETRPLPALKMVAFGSDDGRVYVALSEERSMLYRIATGGAVGVGLGTYGTRLLLVPSQDRNLYGIDLFTAEVLWTYPSGEPITQEPLVAGGDIFVVTSSGRLSSIDPRTGAARWTTSTQGGRLLSIGAKRIYLESADEDLFVVDRATGQTVADPRATFERMGLNFRPYEHGLTNRQNDRIYFATTSGMILCLRELGQTRPQYLRNPKDPLFGYVPSEGATPNPNTSQPGATEPAPAPAPAEGGAAPAEEKEKAAAEPAPAGGDVPAPTAEPGAAK